VSTAKLSSSPTPIAASIWNWSSTARNGSEYANGIRRFEFQK
jgi:hypothetical protein